MADLHPLPSVRSLADAAPLLAHVLSTEDREQVARSLAHLPTSQKTARRYCAGFAAAGVVLLGLTAVMLLRGHPAWSVALPSALIALLAAPFFVADVRTARAILELQFHGAIERLPPTSRPAALRALYPSLEDEHLLSALPRRRVARRHLRLVTSPAQGPETRGRP